jgi:hypothetical protein
MSNGEVNLGPLTPYHPPAMPALAGYAVNREGQNEVIWQPTYDFQTYPVGGATQFTFFQTTVGTGGSTLANTNMRASGQFPSPQEFLCTGIQVFFNPGEAISRAAVAEATIATNFNDVNDVMNGDAWLEFFIGSKPYLDDSPLAKFTQQFKLNGLAAIAGTFTAATTKFFEYAVHCGKYYAITPVKIPRNQNFNVTLNFPTAIPAVTEGKIGVILDGFLYRLSQ